MHRIGVCAALLSLASSAMAEEPTSASATPSQSPSPSPIPPSFPWPHQGFAQPPPGTYPVIVSGDRPGLRFSVATEKDGQPFVYCPHDCTLTLAPGQYWLELHPSPGMIAGKRRFEIEGPARAKVVPRTEDDRSSGMTMGFIGVGLLAGGVVASLVGVGEAIDGSEDRAGWLLLLGVGGIISGAILTPIGFVRGGRSAPRVEVEPLGAR